MPTSGGLYWWTHYFASPKTRNALSFLVGYSNTLGLVGGLCSIDYGFSLMFLSIIVIATDGNWTPSNGVVYCVFMGCVLCHGILASTMSKIMGKLQIVFVIMNFILIFATIIALPVGRANHRNDAHYIFATFDDLTAWPTGWTFMLAWLSPIWTIGGTQFPCQVSAHKLTRFLSQASTPASTCQKKPRTPPAQSPGA